MKKIVLFIVAFLLLFSATVSTNIVLAQDLSDELYIRFAAKYNESQIDVDVNLIVNTGINAMTLELDYDKDIFELVDYEQGTALVDGFDKLEVTPLESERTNPIRFNWVRKNPGNDFSQGKMLTLHFKLLPDVPSGKYNISFKNDEQLSITYNDLKDSTPTLKSAVISRAVVKVEESKITQAEIVEKSDNSNVFLILGITFGSALVVSAAVFAVIKIKREKVRKKNWIKI